MSASKHAYLILAHGNPFVLEKLILLIDDEYNDIYIHVDKKAKDFDFSYFKSLPLKSTLTFVEQVDVRWGHVSMIEAELKLYRSATLQYKYAYYHLVSGADLPLLSQKEIHLFFEANVGKEFLGFSNDAFNRDRVSKIHLFAKHMRVQKNERLKRVGRQLRNLFLRLQQKLNYNRHSNFEGEIVFGTQWASLTDAFVNDLLQYENWFLEFYKYSNCSDEIYKQTFAFNSIYRESIYDFDDELRGCQRFVDWKRGRPYTFRSEDFDLVMNSEMLFARKFEDTVDKDIVEQIYTAIKSR